MIRSLEKLRGCERKILVRILHCLGETDRRGIYLRRGYCSLFEFCTEHLKYSRSAAGRRIAAARALSEFPALESELLSGRITLYSLALASKILTVDNFAEIVPRIRNRSSRDVEALVSGYRPREMFRDRIRPVSILLPDPVPGAAVKPSADIGSCGDGTHCEDGAHCGTNTRCGDGTHCDDGAHCGENTRCGDGTHCDDGAHCGENSSGTADGSGAKAAERTGSITPGAGSDTKRNPDNNIGLTSAKTSDSESLPGFPGISAPASGRMKILRKYRLEFAADPRFIEKLEKTRALLSTRFPTGISLEELFEFLMDEYIDRHSPEARAGRRKDRLETRKRREETRTGGSPGAAPRGTAPAVQGKATAVQGQGTVAAVQGKGPGVVSNAPLPGQYGSDDSRNIPRRIRDEVYLRDGGRCTFRGPDGRRCGSTHDLQIDHIVPHAMGGGNSIRNLRLLCGKHNRLEAERVFGHPLPRRSGERDTRDRNAGKK